MNLDARRAAKVTRALETLNGLAIMTGLHLSLDSYEMALIDRDGDMVARIEWDAASSSHVVTRI